MIDSDFTLGAVFGFSETSSKEASLEAGIAKATSAVAEALTHIPALAHFHLTGDIIRDVATKLAIPVRDLALNTWNERGELRKLADGQNSSSDGSSKVPLFRNELTQTVKPRVTFRVGLVPLPPLEITGKVKFTFENVMLVIRDAHVTDIELGRIKAVIELLVGKAELVKHKIDDIAIKGSYHLKTPLPIRRGPD